MPTYEEPDPLNPEGVDEEGFVPDWYSRGAQVRQFGIGGVSTLGHPSNISVGLAFPPANMSIGDEKLRAGNVVVESKATLYDYENKTQGTEIDPTSPTRDDVRDNSLGTDNLDTVDGTTQQQ